MFYSPTVWDVIFMLFTNLAYRRRKKKTKTAVTHLASATPNMQPPTVDQKPIQPAPTCALGGGNGGEGEKEEEGRTEEGREERRLLVFKMQSVTVRTESDKEQPLSV